MVSDYDLRALRDGALCKDSGEDWWQADPPLYDTIRSAQDVCARCPVQGLCYRVAESYAREAPLWGVWGGKLWWWDRPRWQGKVIDDAELEAWCSHHSSLGAVGCKKKGARKYVRSGKYAGLKERLEARRAAGDIRPYVKSGKYVGVHAKYKKQNRAAGDVRPYVKSGKYVGVHAKYKKPE